MDHFLDFRYIPTNKLKEMKRNSKKLKGVIMANAFEDVMDGSETEVVEEQNNQQVEVISEDSITDCFYMLPPNEKGDFSNEIVYEQLEKTPGKWAKKKDGEEFWTGLTKKDKSSPGGIARVDEYNIACVTVVDGEEVDAKFKIGTWEMYFRIMAFLKHVKTLQKAGKRVKSRGQSLIWKRTGFGQKTAKRNWVLYLPDLLVRVDGENNDIVQMTEEEMKAVLNEYAKFMKSKAK